MRTPQTPYAISRSQTVEVGKRNALCDAPEAAFEIGQAPDGLPVLLHVDRRLDVRSPVLLALRTSEADLPKSFQRPLKALEQATREYSLTLGIHQVGRNPYYETRHNAVALLGKTLLARLLDAVSPMVMAEDRSAPQAAERFETSVALNLSDLESASGSSTRPAPTPTPVVSGHNARLWIGLKSDDVRIAPRKDASSEPKVDGARQVTWESLLGLPSAQYTIRRVDRTIVSGSLREKSYLKALLQHESNALGWSVTRADLAGVLVSLARALDEKVHMHERVHGDLKPGNVFLCEDGAVPFDGLDIPAGEITIGLTAGWGAPEQLMAGAVTPATDSYALALMCVSLMGAAIYGEERALIIPARGDGRRRIRSITDPEVWVDPTVIEMPTKGRVAWREFLMHNLARDPAKRALRGRDFADQLATLVERWPPPGRLTAMCGPGRLVDIHGWRRGKAWVVSDAHVRRW